MWQPEPGWQPVPGGRGPSTVGVWRAELGGRQVVVKRLERPPPAETVDPWHAAWWRRSADVAVSRLVESTPGLRSPTTAIEEDADGITLYQDWVEDSPGNGLHAAACLGRFAGVDLGSAAWLARDLLPDRIRRIERRGGWPTLARTGAADVADHLWRLRESRLGLVEGLPVVAQHGDPTPANLRGRLGEHIVAIDWATLGTGPVGCDVGYVALSATESFETLVDAYVAGLPPGLATRDEAALGARVTAVYTAISRAEWALARIAPGEGALAGKLHHPSVAPYLRAVQRLSAQVEALV